MSDRSTYKFTIQNKDVRTTVVSTGSELDKSLGKLLSTIGAERHMKRLVGINIQKVYTPLESGKLRDKVAVLTLCSGLSCLVIHLLHFRTIPSSIAAFFELPDISFVGVGIKHCVDALERDYGIGCRNAIDLGQLVSINKEEPKLSALGLGDLAYEAGLFNVGVTAPGAAFSDWGADRLNSEQIKSATTTAFMAFLSGNRLLGGMLPSSVLMNLPRKGSTLDIVVMRVRLFEMLFGLPVDIYTDVKVNVLVDADKAEATS